MIQPQFKSVKILIIYGVCTSDLGQRADVKFSTDLGAMGDENVAPEDASRAVVRLGHVDNLLEDRCPREHVEYD
jgi:hypothetical protein